MEPRGSRPEDSLTVVSWNVHVDGADIVAFVRALRAGDLTDAEPVGAFVLLLQEAYRARVLIPPLTGDAPTPPGVDEHPPGHRPDIVAVARTLGLHLYYVASMRNGREPPGREPEDRGNAILSSVPLSDYTAVELPFARHRRVVISATVATTDPPALRVVSAHVDASGGPGRLWVFSSGIRARQARHVIEAVSDDPAVVTGVDLNSWAEGLSEPAVQAFRKAFPQTKRPSLTVTFRLPFRLDYLFFRLPGQTPIASRRVADRFGSDHHALVARVGVRVRATREGP